ncbi:hypothetical protein FBUS_06483 [Fasciolopsis buskii]|uniref:CLASP N-terminal domain-containing protein n=1 Tax=Fasciolopsis buskii TaxID=27845 RepID=A0A8E0RW55_9TREM|nr:hypothetical protein FBUS_06483 [Fasciolopsis buski]
MQIISQSPKLSNRNFISRLPDLKGDVRSVDDLLNRLISGIEVGDWDEQLKGLKTFKCLIEANNHEIMNKLLTNDYLLQRLIRGVVRAVTNLRSQLSRCAVSSINLFGAYLRSTRQGHLLDVQADRILSALLRRVGADRSIKFLYNESFDALCSITRALSPTVVVNLLCLQVSEQKAKSAKTRIVVGNILRQRMEIITHSVEDMEEFSRQFSAEGMERLIKVAAILTEDRLSETRAHGREIFRLVSRIKDIREFCRQKLPDRVWRVIQPIFQESSKS